MSTQIILLERVENLGEMGDVVSVKPGFARNYLLPQKKALRASKQNLAYFDAQKKTLQAENEKKRKAAETLAKKIEGIKVPVIRQASEAGQLFGSVNSRDIAAAVAEKSKESITRDMVYLNQNIKTIGLIPVDVILHPEVKVEVIVNIARSNEEAQIQEETGRALISDNQPEEAPAPSEPELSEETAEEVFENPEDVLAEDAAEDAKAEDGKSEDPKDA